MLTIVLALSRIIGCCIAGRCFSGAVSNPFNDAEKAECVVIIGACPAWNHPVVGTYIKQAAKKGTKLIIMDPRGQDLVRHATVIYNLKAVQISC